jgi:hypothetical protein
MIILRHGRTDKLPSLQLRTRRRAHMVWSPFSYDTYYGRTVPAGRTIARSDGNLILSAFRLPRGRLAARLHLAMHVCGRSVIRGHLRCSIKHERDL